MWADMRIGLTSFIGFGLLSLVACGGGEPRQTIATDSRQAIQGGTLHTEAEVAQFLSDAGFDDATIPKMVCTAKYESSFWDGDRSYNRRRGKVVSTDWGLFQINDHAGWLDACGVTTSDLLDPVTNTRCAKIVFDTQGISAWAGYNSHAPECDSYQVDGWSGSGAVAGAGNQCAQGETLCDDGTCGLGAGQSCTDDAECCSSDCSTGTCGRGGAGSGTGGSSGGGGSCVADGDGCNDGPDCCGYADRSSVCQEDPNDPSVAYCTAR
jgi:hypothetical protein